MKVTKKQFTGAIASFSALAIVASPAIASAATQSANTTINATLGSAITVTTSTTVNVAVTPTAGGVVSSASDTVTVNTNNSTGYVLTLADSDATTSLASGGNTIAAHTGTQASPTTLANNRWGYRVVSVGGFGATAYSAETNNGSSTSTWAGVPASGSANTIKSTASTATNDATTVWYGIKATSSQPSGTYTGTVTYTATTN